MIQSTLALPLSLQLQERAARMLSRAVVNRTTHAFMLSGTPGVGTHEAAMWIAKSVLCASGGCDECDVCRRVSRRVHPDLLWIAAEGAQLLNEHVEEMIDQLVRRPFEASAQVAVIEDADTLGATNDSTANRLLKVLEDPPGDVVFVLLATLPDRVLPTIRSRILDVRFPRLSDAAVRQWLDREGLAAGVGSGIDAVVRAANGDLHRATEFVTGGAAKQRHDLVCNVASGLIRSSMEPSEASRSLLARANAAQAVAIELAEKEFEAIREQLPKADASKMKNSRDSDGHEARTNRRGRRALTDEVRETLTELLTWYRDLLAVTQGANDAVLYIDALPELRALSETRAAQLCIAALDTVEELYGKLHLNFDMAIALDALCAELSGLAAGRIRARRTLGIGSRTPQGYEILF